MGNLKRGSRVILVASSIGVGVLFLVGAALALAPNDLHLDASALTTTGKEVVSQPILPPTMNLPPTGPDLKPLPPAGPVTPKSGAETLENGKIEFVSGWAPLAGMLAPDTLPIDIPFINRSNTDVQVRVAIFQEDTLAPVHVEDQTLKPHAANTLRVRFTPTPGRYWAIIQADSEEFIVQEVRFLSPTFVREFEYEKIAAFALPSRKRLW